MKLVYTTLPDKQTAVSIAQKLLEQKLIACANIIPGVVSIFEWEGACNQESEVICLYKTANNSVQKLMDVLENMHPYETPAIVCLSAEETLPAFESWVATQCID